MIPINTPIKKLSILIWNVNGLFQYRHEFNLLLQNKNIDIALISESHFTAQSYVTIYGYQMY